MNKEWISPAFLEAENRTLREHLARYQFATQFSRGVKVLDVACGGGYGSQILAAAGAKVVGVDIGLEQLRHGVRYYPHERVGLLQADATALPFSAGFFDVVVSFETLEHVEAQEAFIGEIKRVLKPGGLIIMSTPDKEVYNIIIGSPNQYHVGELTLVEFRDLMERHFIECRFYGQTRFRHSAHNVSHMIASVDRFRIVFKFLDLVRTIGGERSKNIVPAAVSQDASVVELLGNQRFEYITCVAQNRTTVSAPEM